jgi:hypothetical protein
MANRVIKLNDKETNLWYSGLCFKSLSRVKNSYYKGDICEIRKPNNDRICFAKVILVEKAQTAFQRLFNDRNHQTVFEANLPPAPIVTFLTFEILDKQEAQE